MAANSRPLICGGDIPRAAVLGAGIVAFVVGGGGVAFAQSQSLVDEVTKSVTPSPMGAPVDDWHHAFGGDGILVWNLTGKSHHTYFPPGAQFLRGKGERPVDPARGRSPTETPIDAPGALLSSDAVLFTLLWYNDVDASWWYSTHTNPWIAVTQLGDLGIAVPDIAKDLAFAAAATVRNALEGSHSGTAEFSWVPVDAATYAMFPAGLSRYLRERVASGNTVPRDKRNASATFAQRSSCCTPNQCCRTFADPDCLYLLAPNPQGTIGDVPGALPGAPRCLDLGSEPGNPCKRCADCRKICPSANDIDGDGIRNEDDPDVDGDGILNGDDDDVDGDGISNGNDSDVDGDGVSNGHDDDIDGDDVPNGNDDDTDGDGISNSEDDDIDGDGIPNSDDDDIDGDGSSNSEDDTPNGCTGTQACCGSTDPCCGSSNPCCGVDCGDDDVCNGNEICVSGSCRPGTPLDCDDGDPCTLDSCDPVIGCMHPPDPAPADKCDCWDFAFTGGANYATGAGFTEAAFNGSGALKPLADDYLQAANDLLGVASAYQSCVDGCVNAENPTQCSQDCITVVQTAGNDFVQRANNIRAAADAVQFSVRNNPATRMSGDFQLGLVGVPGGVAQIPLTIRGEVVTWLSTQSFGDTAWTSITPAAATVGSTTVTVLLNGNYASFKVVATWAECLRVKSLSLSVVSQYEERLHAIHLKNYNTRKSAISQARATVAVAVTLVKDATEIVAAISVVGEVIKGPIKLASNDLALAVNTSLNDEDGMNCQQLHSDYGNAENLPEEFLPGQVEDTISSYEADVVCNP